eukprot:Nitzschia sp. Nitz4//scaffold42_size132992//5258//6073//NITZ4_003377-RA/size132992-processed-gene-0.24-mRNA-1//-1//CDS//3329551652//8985//frame0
MNRGVGFHIWWIVMFAWKSSSLLSKFPCASAFVLPVIRKQPSFVTNRHLMPTATNPANGARRSVWSLWDSSPSTSNPSPDNILEIVKYPHPALRAKSVDIPLEILKRPKASSQDSHKEQRQQLQKLAQDMLNTMYESEGVGLAAPQVGVNQRLMVYNPMGDPNMSSEETVLVNPKIVHYDEETDEMPEGCLSFPDMQGNVVRSLTIHVKALTLQGKKVNRVLEGWEARIFQHEYDHLEGVVYIDRLSKEDKETIQPKIDKLIQEFGGGGVL